MSIDITVLNRSIVSFTDQTARIVSTVNDAVDHITIPECTPQFSNQSASSGRFPFNIEVVDAQIRYGTTIITEEAHITATFNHIGIRDYMVLSI